MTEPAERTERTESIERTEVVEPAEAAQVDVGETDADAQTQDEEGR
jgi:hypothetical protein